jgi:hypothetical protein
VEVSGKVKEKVKGREGTRGERREEKRVERDR